MRNILLVFSLSSALGCAQSSHSPNEPTPVDDVVATEPVPSAVEEHLFAAELVMDHQAALGLDDAQADALRSELARAQAELVEAEWTLRRAREALVEMLSGPRVDEAAAMEAAERVIEAENAVKRIHLRLLVRIKNHLTPTQQTRLRDLRGGR